MATQRQSNIELCRLLSILLVMLVHTTHSPLVDLNSIGELLLEGFSIIGVNVFVLITGYFSTTPKKTSLINLAFICMFWGIIKAVCHYLLGIDLNYTYLFFITHSSWFITCYIGLLFITPILNSFCNSVNKRTLWGVVISLLLLEMWFDWLPPRPEIRLGFQGGYSVFSFMILYLLARAIRLHGLPKSFKRISPLLYVVCSIALGVAGYVSHKVVPGGLCGLVFAYSNPLVILSSVSFLMTFQSFNFKSTIINHLAKSTLAVLLGHTTIMTFYKSQFYFLYDHFNGLALIGYWSLAILIVFCGTIAVDQLRLLLYKPVDSLLKRKIKNDIIYK